MTLRKSLILAALALPGGAGTAQGFGDVTAGQRLAIAQCAECHAVLNEEDFSPYFGAPTFESIAARPELTSTALRVWLKSSIHEDMPLIVLTHTEVEDVIAYIESLED